MDKQFLVRVTDCSIRVSLTTPAIPGFFSDPFDSLVLHTIFTWLNAAATITLAQKSVR